MADISTEAILEIFDSYYTHLQQCVEAVSKLANSSNEMLSVLTAHSFPVEALPEIGLVALKHDHAKEQLTEAAQLFHDDFQRLIELMRPATEAK